MKKLGIVLLTLVLLLTGCGPSKPTQGTEEQLKAEQEKFEEYLKAEMTYYLSTSKMGAHFALKDLAPYGLENMEVSIGSADESDYNVFKESLGKLKEINRGWLTEGQQSYYDRYKLSLEETLTMEGLSDYSFYFSPSTGTNNNLLTLFTEFELRSEEDIKELILYIIDSERYLDDCIDITKKQIEKGIVQADSTLDGIIEQAEKFINSKDKNSVTVTICKQIDNFSGLSTKAKDDYKKQVKDAVNKYMMAGYEKVVALMKETKGKATNSSAYYNWADGKKYYEARLKIKTSSQLSVADTKKLLEKEINDCINGLVSLATANGALWDMEDVDFGMTDSKEILEHLESQTSMYFPDPVKTNYEVAFLDPSVTAESIAAYYLNPPMDDFTHNVIKVNPATSNTLYTTLAHEGYPGHLYQITYEMENNFNPILYFVDFIGYTEGWAVYTEAYSYSMSKKAVPADVAMFDSYNDRLNTAVMALTDILVHYDGLSVSELEGYYTTLNLNSGIAQLVYDIVLSDPLLYIPYSTGCIMMNNLRDKAEKALGDKFDAREFHKVILDTGRAPFEYLETKVDEYIASK